MNELALARTALAAVCVFWGTTYLAIAVAVHELPPALFCSVRFMLAGAAMLFLALAREERLPRGKEWFNLAVVSFLLLVIGNGMLAWAVQWVPTGTAAIIIVTTPLWMAVFARLSGESVQPQAILGLVSGFLGLIVILWPKMKGAEPGSGFIPGACGLLLSSLVWAAGSAYSKHRPVRTSPLMTAAIQMCLGSLFFAAGGLLLGETGRWNPSPVSWLAIGYLALFGSIIGYGSYLYALSKLPTAQVAIYAYVNPIVAIFLGIWFLGERFEPAMLLGGPMVLLGVFLVNVPAAVGAAPESALPLRLRLLRRLRRSSR
ncbi:MAG: EamA family transporter [Elusimicrobiota bacterium]|jgi:drug/metabolite transporter (DMT)-like permease